jgi:hypothetical protein
MPIVINVDSREAPSSDLIRYEKLIAEDHALEQRRVKALERIAAALEEVNKR